MEDRKLDVDKWFGYEAYGHTKEEYEHTCSVNSGIDECNKVWIEHAEKNKVYFKEENFLTSKYGEWKGCKTVCVAAGPSLRSNIEHIRRAKDEGHKIICVDRAHPYLKAKGVVPDLTVACDHRAIIGDFLRKVKKDDCVAMDCVCHPRVVNRIPFKAGDFRIFSLINPYSAILLGFYKNYPKELFAGRAGFVVGFNATDIAYWMGSDEIALIGHDLSWPDYESIENMYTNSEKHKILKLQNKEGRTKYTIASFYHAVAVFGLLQKLHPETKFYDCSDGILLPFEQITLSEVLDKWQTKE